MKKNSSLSAILVTSAILFLISCKKDPLCDGCSRANEQPIANAGPPQVIQLPETRVVLDGSKSFDPNNKPVTYKWRQIFGAATKFTKGFINTARVEVNCYRAGVYLFELTVSNGAAFSKNVVEVRVNHSPTTEHYVDITFDKNPACSINDNIEQHNYENEQIFQLFAESRLPSMGLSMASITQHRSFNDINNLYGLDLVISDTNMENNIHLEFKTPVNFFVLPNNNNQPSFSDSVRIVSGWGDFINIIEGTSLHCSAYADPAHNTGKIRLTGSLLY